MKPLLLLTVMLTLLGCATGSGISEAEASSRPVESVYSLDWLRAFQDPQLMALAGEAASSNRDLNVLALRLQAAGEGLVIARAVRVPALNFGTSAAESGSSSDGRLSSFESDARIQPGVSVSWEADLWGRLAGNQRAAAADFEALQAELDGARLSLAGQTARAWCSLITARQQLALATETRAGFERNLRVVERSFRNGDAFASALDVKFARNQVASAGRGVEVQKLAAGEARRTLEVLLGRYPEAAIAGRDTLPVLKNDAPASLPAALLERRPDLRAAKARIFAAAERAESSRKALLPSLTLNASGSAASGNLLRAFSDPTSLAASLASSIAQPVFRGGALRASVRQASAQREAAVVAFSAAALKACREVESALATGESLARQYALLLTEVEQASLAERQASREYSQGTVSFLSVLEAQRRAVSARSQIISLMNARLQNRIDLHLALGGGFH